MFKIGRLYHVIHVTSDFEAADRWYHDVFSPQSFYKGYHKVAMRDASLLAIGDLVMEPLAPRAGVAGVERSALYKFRERFGQRLHSIAWYVPDAGAVYERLKEHKVRMLGEGGGPLEGAPKRGGIFTHPRDTFGQHEFAVPGGAPDPRLQPGWSTAFWRDQHLLGIERASHVTVVVRDLAKAKAFYAGVLGGRLLHEGDSSEDRALKAFLFIGEATVVELAQPLSDEGRLGKDLAQNGEIIHSVTFKVRDVAKAEAFLKGNGMRLQERRPDSFILDPADSFGAVFGFTQRSVPNDPRR